MDIVALNYLGNIFDVANLLAMLLGVLVGLVIGAIPGLSPPMAIALMIPVSFQFPPETALILLVSCFAAGIYGGHFLPFCSEHQEHLLQLLHLLKGMK